MWITITGICDNGNKEMSIQRENSRKITQNLKNNTLHSDELHLDVLFTLLFNVPERLSPIALALATAYI